jgi:pimeloyl-ACP methyl ester carboxylesterase
MTTTSLSAATQTTGTVVSADGATISYLTMGRGPSVIVIPGALFLAAHYSAFGRALAEQFTVHIIERRGRGLSSPQGANYSIRKECEDVLALQRETGASLLVGHSFGGLVALEVARNNRAFTTVAVYEPGVSIGGSISTGWIPGYEKKLAEKKYLDAFIEYSLGTGPDRARPTPHWLMKLLLPLFLSAQDRKLMLGLLPETLREHREQARLDSSYGNYREISADVLLMHGGRTHINWVELAIERLATVLPHAERKEFPRLNHFGIDKQAPREVARAVSAYFLQREAGLVAYDPQTGGPSGPPTGVTQAARTMEVVDRQRPDLIAPVDGEQMGDP